MGSLYPVSVSLNDYLFKKFWVDHLREPPSSNRTAEIQGSSLTVTVVYPVLTTVIQRAFVWGGMCVGVCIQGHDRSFL